MSEIMHDALAGAVDFATQQQSSGIPPLDTAAAAAMLIGLIVGEGAAMSLRSSGRLRIW
jgi:hypothetical protein